MLFHQEGGGQLSCAEVTMVMNRLRALSKSFAWSWEEAANHPAMGIIESSFLEHKQDMQLLVCWLFRLAFP